MGRISARNWIFTLCDHRLPVLEVTSSLTHVTLWVVICVTQKWPHLTLEKTETEWHVSPIQPRHRWCRLPCQPSRPIILHHVAPKKRDKMAKNNFDLPWWSYTKSQNHKLARFLMRYPLCSYDHWWCRVSGCGIAHRWHVILMSPKNE